MEKGLSPHLEAREDSQEEVTLALVLKGKSSLVRWEEKERTVTGERKAQSKGRNYSERATHLPQQTAALSSQI